MALWDLKGGGEGWLGEFSISADHMCHPETFTSFLRGRHICSFANQPYSERERKTEREREMERYVGVCECACE